MTSGLRPALWAASLIYVGQLRRVLQAGAGRAHEAVGEPTSPARGRRHAGAEPERRPRPLERSRGDLHVLERVMLAAECKPLPRPAQAQDLDALLEERYAVFHRHVEGAEVGGLIADPDPQDNAALGDKSHPDR